MTKKMAFWLESIVEDDPLPDEIKIIVFKICTCGNYRYIEMLGMENELNLNRVYYRPLEAQFFSDQLFLNCSFNLFVYRVKQSLDECFNSEILNEQYKNRKFYLFVNDFDFLFSV